MARPAYISRPVTPSKARLWKANSTATEALEAFGVRAKLSFSKDKVVPAAAKRRKSPRCQIREKFKHLFWLDKSRLEFELLQFLEYLPAFNEEEKLDYLVNHLGHAFEYSPSVARYINRSAFLLTSDDSAKKFQDAIADDVTAPSSPTTAIRHAPPLEDVEEIVLPERLSQNNGLRSNNTSFVTSIFSEGQDRSQPTSTATSFSSVDQTDGAADNERQASEIPWSSMSTTAWDYIEYLTRAPQPEASRDRTVKHELTNQQDHVHSPGSGKKRRREEDDHNKGPIDSGIGRSDTHGISTQASEYPMSSDTATRLQRIGQVTDVPSKMFVKPQTPPNFPPAPLPKSASESPTRNWRIRKLPEHGLSQILLPLSFTQLPFDLRLEALRVLQKDVLTPEALDMEWQQPRSMDSLHSLVQQHEIDMKRGFETAFSDCTLCAKLSWRKPSTGPLVSLELLPPRREKSHSLARRHGGHRFLHVDSVSPLNPPSGFCKDDNVFEAFQDMLHRPHRLLGRTWILFFVRDKKRKKRTDASMAFELSFFAIDGVDIDNKVSISEFLNGALKFGENSDQLSGKLHARLELLLSRTNAGPIFTDDQISWTKNIPASNIQDATEFNRTGFVHPPFDKTAIMNDGTSSISAYAMAQICKSVGYEGLPSIVQGRFRGAKGTFPLDGNANQFVDIVEAPEKRISINDSQIKIRQHEAADEHDSTFNVNGFNQAPKPSVLYPGFLPILEHNGVPRSVLKAYVHMQVELYMDLFEQAIKDPVDLRRWLHAQNEISLANREFGIDTIAGGPALQTERIFQLLEAGFEPTKCRFLADELYNLMERVFTLKEKNFKIPCPRSCQLMGTVDTTGIVQPGEVHIKFSNPFFDARSGGSRSSWHGMAALVCRNPARRSSDIRKLRIKCYPELDHLTDCIVFSSLGPQPEGSKMQGGDYDGDIYWVCVEPKLVDPFENTPAPTESELPGPEAYFIRKIPSMVSDVITIPKMDTALLDEDEVRKWIRSNNEKRMNFNYLAAVTLKHEALTYRDNDIASEQAMHLNNLADYLMDAAKRCFEFTRSDWTKVQKIYNIPSELPTPTHRKFTSLDDDADSIDEKDWNRNNIIDQIYLGVLKPESCKALERVKAATEDATVHDDDLKRFYNTMLQEALPASPMATEIHSLQHRFEEIKEVWQVGMAKVAKWKNPRDRVECLIKCRGLYEEIRPLQSCEGIDQWLKPLGNDTITMWDLLKASAFAVKNSSSVSRSKMMFNVAGDELCRLKAPAMGATRTLTMASYLSLKPGKYKAFVTHSDPEDEEQDAQGEIEDEYPIDETLFQGIS